MLDARAAKTRMTAAATAVTQVMMGPSVAAANIVDACASMCARLIKCRRSYYILSSLPRQLPNEIACKHNSLPLQRAIIFWVDPAGKAPLYLHANVRRTIPCNRKVYDYHMSNFPPFRGR